MPRYVDGRPASARQRGAGDETARQRRRVHARGKRNALNLIRGAGEESMCTVPYYQQQIAPRAPEQQGVVNGDERRRKAGCMRAPQDAVNSSCMVVWKTMGGREHMQHQKTRCFFCLLLSTR